MFEEEWENRTVSMPHKGYGRIYVEKKEDIQKVKDIIKQMDEFEYGYLPKDLITVFEGKKEMTYTHKFADLDINDLIIKCWNQGIKCFYIKDC
jgi:predicted RNA-binding protein with EMAP domain